VGRYVRIVTRLRAGRSGDQIPTEAKNCFLLKNFQTGSEALPASSCCVQLPGSAGNHSPGSSVEVKNEWSYVSIPLYAFMVWRGAAVSGE
jgi:hypothetical protein